MAQWPEAEREMEMKTGRGRGSGSGRGSTADAGDWHMEMKVQHKPSFMTDMADSS